MKPFIFDPNNPAPKEEFVELWAEYAPTWCTALGIDHKSITNDFGWPNIDNGIGVFRTELAKKIANYAGVIQQEGGINNNADKLEVLEYIVRYSVEFLWQEAAEVYNKITYYHKNRIAVAEVTKVTGQQIKPLDFNNSQSSDFYKNHMERVHRYLELVKECLPEFEIWERRFLEFKLSLDGEVWPDEKITNEIKTNFVSWAPLKSVDKPDEMRKEIREQNELSRIICKYGDRYIELYVTCKRKGCEHIGIGFDENEYKKEAFDKLCSEDVPNAQNGMENAVIAEIKRLQNELNPPPEPAVPIPAVPKSGCFAVVAALPGGEKFLKWAAKSVRDDSPQGRL